MRTGRGSLRQALLPVLAELRKVPVRLAVALGLLLSVLCFGYMLTTQEWAVTENEVVAGILAAQDPCPLEPGSVSEAEYERVCAELLAVQDAADQRFVEQMRIAGVAIAAQQTVLGPFAVVAGMLLSLPGAVLLSLLVAALTAGEWDRGSATLLWLADSRVWRVAFAKSAATWIVLMGLFLGSSTLVVLAHAVGGARIYPLDTSAVDTGELAGLVAWRCVVLATIAAVLAGAGTAVAMWARSRMVTVVLCCVLAVVANAWAMFPTTTAVSPQLVIAEIAGFTVNPPPARDHLSLTGLSALSGVYDSEKVVLSADSGTWVAAAAMLAIAIATTLLVLRRVSRLDRVT